MEYLIYQELKSNIENNLYDGKKVIDELKTGDYLKVLKCRELDEKTFTVVSGKIRSEMEKGFLDSVQEVPFFVRDTILNAKFGDRLYGVSINKKFITNLNKAMEKLKTKMGKKQIDDLNFIKKLSATKNRQKTNERSLLA